MDHRDFDAEMDEYRTDDPMFIAGEDFELVSGDSGESHRDYETIMNRTPPTERMQEDRKYTKSLRSELVVLENRMNESEYQSYSYVVDNLGSDSEKIYFLGLTNSEKRSYLELKGVRRQSTSQNSRNIASVPSKSLRVGMTMNEVIGMYGYPEQKDVAGSYMDQSERWIYSQNGQSNYVYFSQSRVQSWE
jgi:hypothetical protein